MAFQLFSYLKSNMDRFIDIDVKSDKQIALDLKSNMDRFIEDKLWKEQFLNKHLKSNMDRFIGRLCRHLLLLM